MAHRRQLLAGVGLAAIIALVVVVMFWRLTHADLEPQVIAANHLCGPHRQSGKACSIEWANGGAFRRQRLRGE